MTQTRMQYYVISSSEIGSPGWFVRVGLMEKFIKGICILCLGLAFYLVGGQPAYAGICSQAPSLARGNGDELVWKYSGPADCAGTYNLRWAVRGGGYSQVEISGSDHCHLSPQPDSTERHICVTPFRLEPDKIYAIWVQACDKRTLVESSSCSVWSNIVMLPFGLDTCQVGFVWREAFPRDHVCINPERRQNVVEDNAHAAARRNPNGETDMCFEGFIWRQARPTDHVCVTFASSLQAMDDNAQASERVWRP
jgi:hypothetical protein